MVFVVTASMKLVMLDYEASVRCRQAYSMATYIMTVPLMVDE